MIILYRLYIVIALCLFGALAATAQEQLQHQQAQWREKVPDWFEFIEPFKVINNIYYVGTRGLSSFLIVSMEGHILIDGGMSQNADQIVSNIKALGFDIKDVKILLNSHAHFDHSGGLKALKDMSGATFFASEGDRSALEGGFYLGFEDNPDYYTPPIRLDRVIDDNDTVTLGGVTLTAKLTPGHTRGCTSWTMTTEAGNKTYDILFFCGASVAGNKLVPEQYEGIVDDYRFTFEATRNWQPDILLVNHPFYFDMHKRRKRQIAGDPLAFVDKGAFKTLWQQLLNDFKKRLAEANRNSD